MKMLAALSGLLLPLWSTFAAADDNPLLGTWKLKSFVREVFETGEKFNQFGDHPDGYLNYSPDGRMYIIIAADNRIQPTAVNPTNEERAKLHQTLTAYAGTYSLEAGKVIHHLDISWNQAWTGTDQVRYYKIEGNTLTITTAPIKSPVDGREGKTVLVWDKVTAPTH